MATAAIEKQTGPLSDTELTRAIAAAGSAIKNEQKDVERLENQIAEATEKLASLRGDYGSACKALARGDSADVLGLQDKTKPVEAKLEGLKAAIAEKNDASLAALRVLR